jgi:IS1 family transposase
MKTVDNQYGKYGMRTQARKLWSYGWVKITSQTAVYAVRKRDLQTSSFYLMLCKLKTQNPAEARAEIFMNHENK